MESKQCSFIKQDGQKCEAWALKGKDFCYRHDPDSRENSLQASRRGGLVKCSNIEVPLEVVPVSGLRDVVQLLTKTINELRAGQINPRVANALGYLATCLIKALEVAELDAKNEELKNILLQRNLYKERMGE
jgi:hypothetical protein